MKVILLQKSVVTRDVYISASFKEATYRYAPHNDISVNDGLPKRRWPHNIIILTVLLQFPTVFSTVTCCTVCSLGAIGYTI